MGCLPEDKALGVKRNTEKDTLGFTIKLVEKPSSRRGLLLMLSSVNDPLGLGDLCLKEDKSFSNCAKRSCNGINKLIKGQHMSGLNRKIIC